MQTPSHKHLRPAFTIIEILVSVIILSYSIVYVLKIHSSNHEQIVYISERNKHTLSDSLYLSKNVLKYHKNKKSAYELVENDIKLKELESRNILKEDERSVFIPQAIIVTPPAELGGPSFVIQEVKLKGEHSSIYWHFELNP
ncbi:MAG: hypothetical protein GQ531_06015 [Sulfurovum sp.]|nr:hypothetical protein [Sulfurovum sp.]